MAAIFINGSGRNEQYVQRMLLTKIRCIWLMLQRRRILKISKSEIRIVCDGHAWNGSGQIENLDRGFKENLPYRASYQVLDDLVKAFSAEKNVLKWPIRNKNFLWWPCLLMDPDEMSNHYRGSPIDTYFLRSFGSFGQLVSVEKNLKKSANHKQKSPLAARFVNGSGRNEQSL